MKLNRKTINVSHTLICHYQCSEKERFIGIVEVEKAFFGPPHFGQNWPHERGRSASKQPAFGISQHNGRFYTELVSYCSAATLQSIICGKVSDDSVTQSYELRGYGGPGDVGYNRHFRINKSIHFASNGVRIECDTRGEIAQ